ncbi:MAG TPA: R3H domain-containing nucleic acid-binding protein [Propionibacteriaceae bacterium]
MSDVLEQTGGDDAGSGPGRDVTATSGPVVENEPTERSAQETRVRGGAAATPESSEDADAEGAAPDEDEDSDDGENTLEGEAEIAADYLEELLDIADLDGDIDTYIEGERAHVSIVSESEILVGERGEVLDALQELTRLAVMTETGDRSRLMLDVAGFRDRRRQELVAQASAAVERAVSSQQPVPLEPMNPFERKIVHDAVAAAGLSSESEGDEPHRHVVVQPQK